MVTVIVDNIKHTGKEVIVKEWNSHAKKEFIHVFADEYDKADQLIKQNI